MGGCCIPYEHHFLSLRYLNHLWARKFVHRDNHYWLRSLPCWTPSEVRGAQGVCILDIRIHTLNYVVPAFPSLLDTSISLPSQPLVLLQDLLNFFQLRLSRQQIPKLLRLTARSLPVREPIISQIRVPVRRTRHNIKHLIFSQTSGLLAGEEFGVEGDAHGEAVLDVGRTTEGRGDL